jgi:Ca-activated chloride channel family protein
MLWAIIESCAVKLRLAILGGLSLLSSPTVLSQGVFRSSIDVVNVGVAVLNRAGDVVPDLAATDFEVLENGRAQNVRYFTRGGQQDGDAVALHVGLLFDTSGSMSEDIRLSRSAAIRFLNRLPHAEDMTVVDFDTEVRIATYAQSDFTRLVARLRNRRPDGWTALYDALGVYVDGVSSQQGDKVLVVYTDGGDTRSAMTFADALTALRASDVTVYAIGFLEHQSSFTRNEQRLQLHQMAEATGGQAFFPSSMKDIEQIYDRILKELQGRYVLGYVSSDARTDGAWRSLEVRLRRPELKGLKIRTRKGYFAPYKASASR